MADHRQHSKNDSAGRRSRMLWIDGVGGFLIVSGDEWLIGGPGADASVEINVQGDLSRRAAAIRRQNADYVLQPLAETHLAGEKLDRPSLMRDGDAFQLGGSVQMVFHKTHPLSSSARVDVVSHHRMNPRTDGVILLADTCVMGPSRGAHISCPKWKADTIVFLSGDTWNIRSDEELSIDGTNVGQRAQLDGACRIEGESVALSIENLETF